METSRAPARWAERAASMAVLPPPSTSTDARQIGAAVLHARRNSSAPSTPEAGRQDCGQRHGPAEAERDQHGVEAFAEHVVEGVGRVDADELAAFGDAAGGEHVVDLAVQDVERQAFGGDGLAAPCRRGRRRGRTGSPCGRSEASAAAAEMPAGPAPSTATRLPLGRPAGRGSAAQPSSTALRLTQRCRWRMGTVSV